MHDNDTAVWSAAGTYSTHLFTDRAIEVLQNHDPVTEPLFLIVSYQAVHGPLEVPDSYVDQCSHVTDNNRKLHCAMTAAMDEGMCVTALCVCVCVCVLICVCVCLCVCLFVCVCVCV